MEQNTDAGVPVVPMVENKQKSGKGLKIVTAIACVVAVCGIGFGVYGMIRSFEKDNQISSLKTQTESLDNKIMDLENKEIEKVDNIIIEDEGISNLAAGGYIYIGEWGIKIKIPEEIKMVSYLFQHYKYAGQEDRTSVNVTGTTVDVDVLPDFANIKKCGGLGAISRLKKGTETLGGGLIFSDSNYDYYYDGPQAPCSTNSSEQELETAATNLIKQMLTNPDSYFAF